MFTGLIETVGKFAGLEKRAGGGLLSIAHEPWDRPLQPGDSVAVQGACLTVVTCGKDRFTADVLEETLQKTTLGQAKAGADLNLERALPADGRLGGHIVTGHVDGRGQVDSIDRAGDDWVLRITGEQELLLDLVPKGSVALQGVSLTVVDVADSCFSVHIIPYTWQHTSLSSLQAGEAVNLETDILAKYVRRQLQAMAPEGRSSLTFNDLQRAGFQ